MFKPCKFTKHLTILLCVAVFAGLCFGQRNGGDGRNGSSFKLADLSVVGNVTADATFIKLNSGLTVGSELTGDDIRKSIKQLWNLKLFSDIQIVLEKQVGNSVYLTIKVEEYPRLDKIELEGNNKVKKKDLEKELPFYKGQVITPNEVRKAEKNITKLYEEKGYLLAEVTPELRPNDVDKNKVVLRLKIKEHNKVKIQGVHFHGNTAFDDDKLRKQLKDTKKDGFLFFGGGDFDEVKYAADKQNLRDFYNKEGFRDAEVLRDSIYYDSEKKSMFIDIWVDEGIRYYFGDITWEGNELFADEQLNRLLDFQEGDVYNKEKIEKAVFERIGGLYYDTGYIYANITPQETPTAVDTVHVNFRITEGNAVKINKINIVGNTKTKEKVIRREIRMRPGDTFSREALIRTQRDIFILNYFADVRPDVQPISDEEVDVTIEVEEKSTDTANLSAGYSERDKFIGSIGVTMNNFFGNGQVLSFDWNFGRAFRAFSISFTEPWFRDTPTLFGISLYDTKRDGRFTGYDQRSQGASLRLGRRLNWPDNFFRLDWIYRIDRTELSNFAPAIIASNPNGIATQDWPQTTSSVTQIITRNSLDRPEFPTFGSRVSLQTELSGGFLGGNVGFLKNTISAEFFVPLVFNLVLFPNFQAGYLTGFGQHGENIPFLEHYFMGGEGLSRSIPLRGYEDPLSTQLTTPGGKVMFKYGVEVRFPIAPNPTIFGILFAEAGNTWESLKTTDLYDLRRAVGFGFRIFMPMLGIIGFDYAYGFDNFNPVTGRTFGKWKPHFVFGRSF